MNNFYNEPSAISALAKLGTTIPWLAFPICMSAILAVYLGNSYGYSHAAIPESSKLLERLTNNQWEYYLNECLQADELIIFKLMDSSKTQERWFDLVEKFKLDEKNIKIRLVNQIITASKSRDHSYLTQYSGRLLRDSRM